MKSLASFASVFVIASIVSVKCLSAEETNAILREVQKDILNLGDDMINIKRKMLQDLQDRDQLILKLNQTISLYIGTYNKAESKSNYTLDISRIHLDSIRALERGLRVEKSFRTGSMIELRNLYQENHDLKQELKSLTENIKNQSQQFKQLQDELKESKTQSRQLKNLRDELTEFKVSERDLRTTLMQIINDQNQELKKLQDEQKENKNQSRQLKELHDELTELKASEKDFRTRLMQIITDQNQELKELQDELKENKNQSRQLNVLQDELKELKAKDLQIRLVQNDSLHASEGRLEIFYDGEWGTVCDDFWDDKDATVVCRMLGFSYGKATIASTFGQGSGRIVLDDVQCDGDESTLDNCQYAWRRHDCFHNEDAGVICKPLTSQDARIPYYRFEILHNGIWGTVCDDFWDDTEATVACRMLDYRYGYTRKTAAGNKTIWLDDVNCTGIEKSIKDCQHRGWGIHNCNSDEDVGILCRDLESRDLRLKGGGLANKGRLEIFHLGHWGTVCDDGWDDQDATVACRMLGFTYGKATIASTFGQGSGRIWLDEVRCEGNETNLEDCHHGGWGRENCFHNEDAGVVCQ